MDKGKKRGERMKSVKVLPEDHKWLKSESANRDKPIYEIVTELIDAFRKERST
jgi:hypothetical protein